MASTGARVRLEDAEWAGRGGGRSECVGESDEEEEVVAGENAMNDGPVSYELSKASTNDEGGCDACQHTFISRMSILTSQQADHALVLHAS